MTGGAEADCSGPITSEDNFGDPGGSNPLGAVSIIAGSVSGLYNSASPMPPSVDYYKRDAEVKVQVGSNVYMLTNATPGIPSSYQFTTPSGTLVSLLNPNTCDPY